MSGGGLEAIVKIQIDLKIKNHPDDVACVVDTGEITKTLQKEKLSLHPSFIWHLRSVRITYRCGTILQNSK